MKIEAMSLVGMADKDNQTGESNQWADAEWLGRARWEVLRFLTFTDAPAGCASVIWRKDG